MILKRLKSNSSFNLLFIPVVAIAFWMKSLLYPFIYDFSTCENGTILYAPIAKLVGSNPTLHVSVSMAMLIALAFIMQAINDRYSFIRIRSKLPSTLFVIVMGGFVGMQTLHPIYFGATFVLLAIYRLFGMFEKAKAYSAVFDVGFLLGVSALFCVNLVVLLPAFIISVAILSRETKWREFVIIIIGFILPFVFAASYAFLTDTLPATVETYIQNIITPVNHFKGNYVLHAYLGVLLLFALISSLDVLKQYDKKKISSRKYFTAFFWIFLCSMVGFVFVPATSQEILVIAAIPLTFLIANFFVFMKRKIWGEFLFAVLVLCMIFIQLLEPFLNG